MFPQALSEVGSGDLVQTERARKAAARKSKMDADLDAESADLMEKKGVSTCITLYIVLCSILYFLVVDPLPNIYAYLRTPFICRPTVQFHFSCFLVYLILTLYLRTPSICSHLLCRCVCIMHTYSCTAWCTKGAGLGGPCLHGG